MKLLTFLTAAVLVALCFLPWVTIETKGLVLTGIDTSGTNFGRPAYFHFILIALMIGLLLFDKKVTTRIAILFAAFNVAWSIRNFSLLSACQMGECPQKHLAIYLLIPVAILLLLFVLFSQDRVGKNT